jgi:hypothetical protein
MAAKALRFYSLNPYGSPAFQRHATREQAIASAQNAVEKFRQAWDDGWDEAVGEVCWGEIKGTVRMEPEGADYRVVQAVLQPLNARPKSKPGVPRWELVEVIRDHGPICYADILVHHFPGQGGRIKALLATMATVAENDGEILPERDKHGFWFMPGDG